MRRSLESNVATSFKVLVEIAARQPNVKQAEIAAKLGITVQAVSEYFKRLAAKGWITSQGPVNYTVTKEGIEVILSGAEELKSYSRFVLGDLLTEVKAWTAIARRDLKQGEKVGLWMEGGLLYAGEDATKTSGVAAADAKKGEDVGITKLSGILELKQGRVTICRVPKIERGGSRSVNYEKLRKLAKNRRFAIALGVEALIALRKINRVPRVFFGAIEAAVESAQHGICPFVVGVEDELPQLLDRLEKEDISYDIFDLHSPSEVARN